MEITEMRRCGTVTRAGQGKHGCGQKGRVWDPVHEVDSDCPCRSPPTPSTPAVSGKSTGITSGAKRRIPSVGLTVNSLIVDFDQSCLV